MIYLANVLFFPSKIGKINFLVNGINEDEYNYCSIIRNNNDMCGTEGKHYKKKRVKIVKIDVSDDKNIN